MLSPLCEADCLLFIVCSVLRSYSVCYGLCVVRWFSFCVRFAVCCLCCACVWLLCVVWYPLHVGGIRVCYVFVCRVLFVPSPVVFVVCRVLLVAWCVLRGGSCVVVVVACCALSVCVRSVWCVLFRVFVLVDCCLMCDACSVLYGGCFGIPCVLCIVVLVDIFG